MTDANEDLWNEAMALLLRWQAEPGDAETRADIVAYCAQSAAHHEAWESAKRLYRLTGEATGVPERARSRQRRRELTRRGAIAGLGAVVLGTAALKGPGLWRQWQADVVSEVGVIRHRMLADGSKLTLGPDSAIQIDFSGAARKLTLLDGMALFDVADDPQRPFEVRAGNYLARGHSGAAFEARRNSGSSMVAVGAGRVEVSGDDRSSAAQLAAGDWIARGPAASAPVQGRRDPAQIAAWRSRKLIAEEDRIDAVVAEIARWQNSRVLIADGGLAASRVSGLYDLRDPLAALRAVVSPYGGHVRQVTPWLTVLSSV
jgi:transmembrane sensor